MNNKNDVVLDADNLLKLPRRVFMVSDFFAYAVNIPLTVGLIFYFLGISGAKLALFSVIVAAPISIAAIVTFFQIRSHFKPVMIYLRKVLEKREFTDEEYFAAKLRFFSTAKSRAVNAGIQWLLLMPIALVLFIIFFNPPMNVRVVFGSLLVINALSVSVYYYLGIDYQIRKFAQSGIFSIKCTDDNKIPFAKTSTILSVMIICLTSLICAMMVPVIYMIIYSSSFNTIQLSAKSFSENSITKIEKFTDDYFAVNADSNVLPIDALKTVIETVPGFSYIAADSKGLIIAASPGIEGDTLKKLEYHKAITSSFMEMVPFVDGNTHKFSYGLKSNNGNFQFFVIINASIIERTPLYVVLFTVIFLITGLVPVAYLMHRIIGSRLNPLAECGRVLEMVGSGKLTVQLSNHTRDDIGLIVTAVSEFSGKLSQIITRIKEISAELASASGQMSVATTSFSTNAQSQAASVEETTAIVEEVNAGMSNVAGGTDKQFESITVLGEHIATLSAQINNMNKSIQETVVVSNDISEKAAASGDSIMLMERTIKSIASSSSEMTGIVGIINDISEQINLLALNAAIEAARAGETGKGFSVVADEISKLADQTAKSINDIDRLIKQNSGDIKTGLSSIDKTTETIRAIIDGVSLISSRMKVLEEIMRAESVSKDKVEKETGNVKTRSGEIRIATDEQRQAMEEIMQTVTSINELTQANAAGAEQMSANSDIVERMAEELKEKTDFFIVG